MRYSSENAVQLSAFLGGAQYTSIVNLLSGQRTGQVSTASGDNKESSVAKLLNGVKC